MNIMVTGGCGFIGSNLIKRILDTTEHWVFNLDKMTYAGKDHNLIGCQSDQKYFFEKLDINYRERVAKMFSEYKPDAVLHLAAESHVDRSISSSREFLETNILGTHSLLEASRQYCEDNKCLDRFKFVLVSTDEVFGSLDFTDMPFTEKSQYQPNSPYSASKAAADHLCRAWHKTYGLQTMITHCSNNYGPRQLPEKLIPNTIFKALNREKIPVYGKGDNVRDWIHVDDHCDALLRVLDKGIPGESYSIGGNNEWNNLDLVKKICDLVDLVRRGVGGEDDPRQSLIEFVTDRKGHDKRYAIDSSKIKHELGWEPRMDFEEGLTNTILWYIVHREWYEDTSFIP